MKVLIFEAYTDANIGSGALIENSIKLVKKLLPKSEISLQAHARDVVFDFTGLPTCYEIFQMPFNQSRVRQIFWLLRNAIWMLAHFIVRVFRLPIPEHFYTYNSLRKDSLESIKKSDICISIGAERINDNFYLGLPFSLYTLWMVKSYGKKLIAFPQTIGPFHFAISKYFARKVLLLCDYIYVRDIRSENTLNMLGISKDKYMFVPDIALLQESCSDEEVRDIMNIEKIPFDKPLCGISAMEWTYFKAKPGSSNYQEYKSIVAAAVDYLIERYNYHVVFVPTNLKMHGCREDDVKTGDEVFDLIRIKDQVTLIRNLYKPGQIKGLFGNKDMVIATRMHACILATGAHAPTLSINYQFKLYEYMKLLGLEENTIDIEKMTLEKLKALIDYTHINRTQIKKQLTIKISELQNMIEERLTI